jgi:3-deoxy-D-manno-octulosonic-acid transferase
VIHAIYSAGLTAALLAYVPVVLARRLRGGGAGANLRERLGRGGDTLPAEPRCWIHAVSVGETITAVPLVDAIRQRWPELSIVLSTVTPTGAQVARERLAGRAVHRYFPLDLPGPVGRVVDAVRPRFFIAMETELWPNFIRALAARGVPCMIANGRVSDRSYRRYRLVRRLLAGVLRRISAFGMQSDEDARRILALGAPPERVVVTGSLKADAVADPAGVDWEQLLGLAPDETLWIAGSTHRGEDEVVLDAFVRLRTRRPRLVLLLAPRHPERAGDVERLARERGLDGVRRTALPGAGRRGAVVVLDTVGELAQLYRLATVVFIGGSLTDNGGHNMLEPALWARPVLFGPHTENFRDSAALLLEAGAAWRVQDGEALERAVGGLLDDPDGARAMGERGRAAVARRQGALRATMDLLEQMLARGDGPRGQAGLR